MRFKTGGIPHELKILARTSEILVATVKSGWKKSFVLFLNYLFLKLPRSERGVFYEN